MAYGKGKKGKGKSKGNKVCKTDTGHRPVTPVEAAAFASLMAAKKKKTPCWSGYEKRGTKKKGGKTVNNCVKKGSKKK